MKARIVATFILALTPPALAQSIAEPVGNRQSLSVWAGPTASTSYDYDITGGRIGADLAGGSRIGLSFETELTPDLTGRISLSRTSADIDRVRYAGPPVTQIVRPTGEMTAVSLEGTLIYAFRTDGEVQPYIGGGLALSDIETEDGYGPRLGAALSAHALAGLRMKVTPTAALFLEARYDALGASVESGRSFSGGGDLSLDGFGVGAGVRIGF
jgi:opacity protein-like surface antigen